jgi:hypothetical protein
MAPQTVRPVPEGTVQTKSETDNLIAQGRARLTMVKPKVSVGADSFGKVPEEAKPMVNAEVTVDGQGRVVITLPALSYAESRDTTSQSRRGYYAVSDDRVDGFIAHPVTGEAIPVTFSLTGLNLSASARRVSG